MFLFKRHCWADFLQIPCQIQCKNDLHNLNLHEFEIMQAGKQCMKDRYYYVLLIKIHNLMFLFSFYVSCMFSYAFMNIL